MNALASHLLTVAIVCGLALAPTLVVGLLLHRRKRLSRERRRSPLTADLLLAPGHSVRERLDATWAELTDEMTILPLLGVLPLAVLYIHSLFSGRQPPLLVLVLILVAVAAFVAYRARIWLARAEVVDNLRLGLDAELAVGQEIDQLMRDGANVFHDLPADQVNIDHVVIARQVVFAVETKGYAKPNQSTVLLWAGRWTTRRPRSCNGPPRPWAASATRTAGQRCGRCARAGRSSGAASTPPEPC